MTPDDIGAGVRPRLSQQGWSAIGILITLATIAVGVWFLATRYVLVSTSVDVLSQAFAVARVATLYRDDHCDTLPDDRTFSLADLAAGFASSRPSAGGYPESEFSTLDEHDAWGVRFMTPAAHGEPYTYGEWMSVEYASPSPDNARPSTPASVLGTTHSGPSPRTSAANRSSTPSATTPSYLPSQFLLAAKTAVNGPEHRLHERLHDAARRRMAQTTNSPSGA